MERNARVMAMRGAAIALGLIGCGCSNGPTSDDGGTTSGGDGGTDGGQGGPTDGGRDVAVDSGQGGAADGSPDATTDGGRDGTADGATGDGGEGGVLACNPAPADMSPCNSNPSCTETCGLNISALTTSRPQRTCTCSGSTASGGRWSCPGSAGACVYPTDVDLTCLQLPAPLPACPVGTPDGGSGDSGSADGGSNLIRTNSSACTLPNSEVCGGVCGSATPTVFSYQDTTGAKVGYCVCIAGIWQCATVSEWPTLGGG
jgi:hypothetical protein